MKEKHKGEKKDQKKRSTKTNGRKKRGM